ncbi:InlB B-repeat-containing protein, partial [uncultured Gemmiger sp.]|uniref:InlB B-repeat-containing protein n=1 Tax=uncultured Gemmiger sp. TaxID=1623490 RepID=UPI0025FA0890
TGVAHFPKDSNVGYVTLTAQFEEVKPEQPEETAKTVEINLNTDNTKGVFVGYDGAATINFKNLPEIGDPIALPEVKANDGYKFTGWKVEGAGEAGHLDANATEFGYTGVAHFPKDSNVGYVTLTAQFEEVKTEQPEETKKTVSVTITTNNEQGIFPDYDGQEVIHFDNLDPNTDQQFELPKVEAKPGYKFIGWHVNGNEVGAWDADTKTFGITGLAHFEKGSNVGYLTIAAVYKAETERTVEVTFSVDPDKGEFEKNDLYTSPAANVMKLTATEFDGTQYAIPTVKAKAGYKFVGWKGQGADVIAWDAEAKTFGVTGLCFFNGDDATTGYATVEAVFEKVEDKKNDNSSSSSSSSSSSNKTTTASNEKQVVKAAAAPANTTKVLPKTGASNVAPLLGGSLAVVALLMGYGVYSLVLRKKD